MSSVCLYFQVHQPRRVKHYRFFDIGEDHAYFNDEGDSDLHNRRVLSKVADKCYLPTNRLLLSLLEQHPEFRVAFSISGVALDQFAEYQPAVLESFQELARTGRVDFLTETHYHSLAFLRSPREFRRQIALHQKSVWHYFGVVPTVFRNTELIYRNDLAREIAALGFDGMLAEGHEQVLGWRSPNYLYHAKDLPRFKVLLKNYRLSDDIAFRFSERSWSEWPLSADTFAHWISAHNGAGEIVNLFLDYETFGEHQWADTGIFDFLRALPGALLRHPDNDFVTPSEALARFESVGEYDAPHYVSWADVERDLSAWISNAMQHDALRALYDLETLVVEAGDDELLHDWRLLTTSDHFYYMCTKWFSDGDVHAYFNPYASPYDAFIAYMNVLSDVRLRAEATRRRSPLSRFLDRCRTLLGK